MPIMATAKTKLYIGGVLAQRGADFAASDFTSQTWKQITPVEGLGQIGDTSEVITFDSIGEGRRKKIKGVRDAGTMDVVLGVDYSDEGQVALIAAEKTAFDYAFKIVPNDAPPGGTPSERLFIAQVTSVAEVFDTVNNVVKLNASLAVNSNVVRVDAAISGASPDNTVLPAITGTATEGQTLTASSGTWSGSPTPTYTYQWFGDGESLAGKTGSTLDLTEDHVGMIITVQVTATNVNGSASAISAGTSEVTSS